TTRRREHRVVGGQVPHGGQPGACQRMIDNQGLHGRRAYPLPACASAASAGSPETASTPPRSSATPSDTAPDADTSATGRIGSSPGGAGRARPAPHPGGGGGG